MTANAKSLRVSCLPMSYYLGFDRGLLLRSNRALQTKSPEVFLWSLEVLEGFQKTPQGRFSDTLIFSLEELESVKISQYLAGLEATNDSDTASKFGFEAQYFFIGPMMYHQMHHVEEYVKIALDFNTMNLLTYKDIRIEKWWTRIRKEPEGGGPFYDIVHPRRPTEVFKLHTHQFKIHMTVN